ncbi:hypothetical protein SBOR_5842 [Sclerotinia borealis F-4128]|uniref:Uncharacterized protein n=1 Tax=Sclerotinia borealis (strain F-4128) TaxID=1432307 RepID=W9CD49_SCLBF|nr:hypothetical protein SBOR_5842 [Sclerotinia borealis F-4128]
MKKKVEDTLVRSVELENQANKLMRRGTDQEPGLATQQLKGVEKQMSLEIAAREKKIQSRDRRIKDL